MPSVEENRIWGTSSQWASGGDHWSGGYGGPDSQWYGSLLPRVHPFVPTGTILEIACGHGRWTQYLKDLGDHLVAVDLNQECIDACRQRFAGVDDVSFVANDGMSLAFVDPGSVDLAFSFDSLVHVDAAVMASYLRELGRVLAPDGVAFQHHSNLGAFGRYLRVSGIPGLGYALRRIRVLERSDHWRDPTVSADVVAALAAGHDLCCISQESITWGGTRRAIDCISVVVRASSPRARPTRRLTNTDFSRQAGYLKRVAELYA